MAIGFRSGPGVLTLVAAIAVSLESIALAAEPLEQQLRIRPPQQTQAERRQEADRLLHLGHQEVEAQRYDAGIAAWYQAIELYFDLGDVASAGLAYNAIARTYLELGRYGEAEAVLRRRLAIALDEADVQGQITGFNNLGSLLLQQGQVASAQTAFQSALRIAEDIQDPGGIGLSLSNLGRVASLQGNLTDAIQYYEAATNYRLQARDPVGLAYSSHALGQLYRQIGEAGKALGAFRVARGAASEARHVPTLLAALDGLIDLYRDRGDLAQARHYLEERMAITGGNAAPEERLGTFLQLGEYYEELGDPLAAEAAYQEALILARQLADKPREAWLLNRLQALQFEPRDAEDGSS